MIDNISLEILKILQEKARIPNIEVSRQVGLAPSAVLERVKKMEKMGIIDGYEVTLNPEIFNRSLIAYIQVSTEKNMDDSVGRQLAGITDIQEVHFISGDDVFLVKLRCKDTVALEDILTKKVKPISGIISTKTNIVLSTKKESSRFPLPQSL